MSAVAAIKVDWETAEALAASFNYSYAQHPRIA
jgi:hypothetical protein